MPNIKISIREWFLKFRRSPDALMQLMAKVMSKPTQSNHLSPNRNTNANHFKHIVLTLNLYISGSKKISKYFSRVQNFNRNETMRRNFRSSKIKKSLRKFRKILTLNRLRSRCVKIWRLVRWPKNLYLEKYISRFARDCLRVKISRKRHFPLRSRPFEDRNLFSGLFNSLSENHKMRNV